MNRNVTIIAAASVAAGALLAGCAGEKQTRNEATAAARELADGPAPAYGKPGFVTFIEDGRLLVFADGSDGLREYRRAGELGKSVTRIGVGPGGMSVRSTEAETITAYMNQPEGFRVFVEDGRLVVFRDPSDELDEYLGSRELGKSVTRVGVGPEDMSVRAPDSETIGDYLAALPGS
jgi:hypothetical protein